MENIPGKLEINETTPIVRSEKFVDIYTNQIRVGMTQNDFTLTFCVTDDHGVDKMHLLDLAAVRMSPQTLKVSLVTLASVLETYEAQFGSVSIATAALASIEENRARLAKIFGDPSEQTTASTASPPPPSQSPPAAPAS